MQRPNVPAMDEHLEVEHKVLDHGFVRLVDYMGDDAAITQAARVSYGTGTKSVNEDRGLIRYLMRNRHSTPFEMCEIKLHVKLPVFVARQWIRHRTANVNEYSARYSILDREFYIPDPDDIQPQSKDNKQGRGGELPEDVRRAMMETILQVSEDVYRAYEELHTGWPWFQDDGAPIPDTGNPAEDETYRRPHQEPHGMARELARIVLPTNIYTQWYWKVDLHNLLHFLSLRADPHAQKEIRAYADVICNLVKTWVPHSYEAFEDYVLGAETFSRQEMEALRWWIAGITSADPSEEGVIPPPNPEGVSDRERADFMRKLGFT